MLIFAGDSPDGASDCTESPQHSKVIHLKTLFTHFAMKSIDRNLITYKACCLKNIVYDSSQQHHINSFQNDSRAEAVCARQNREA